MGGASWGLGDERLKGLWLVVMEREILAFNFQRGRNREKEREEFCLIIFERGEKNFWRKEKIESGGVLKKF